MSCQFALIAALALMFVTVATITTFFIRKLKTSEARLEAIYAEAKNVSDTRTHLLREIDHRVKNNLVSIMGLFVAEKIEAKKNPHLSAEVSLDRLSTRISRLIDVHHLLSENHWGPVDFSALVTRVLNHSLPVAGSAQTVSLDVVPEGLTVSPRQATSLAIILHELAVNFSSHTLPRKEFAKIKLSASIYENYIKIEWVEDGPDFSDLILSGQGFGIGLNLVKNLVEGSLRGTFGLNNNSGAVVTLLLKAEEPRRT